MQWTRTHCCTSHCMAQEYVGALRLIRTVIHVMRLGVVCSLLIPHLVPLRVFLLSLLLLPEPWPVPPPLPCGPHRGNIPLALRQLRSLGPWPLTKNHSFFKNQSGIRPFKNRPFLRICRCLEFQTALARISSFKNPPFWESVWVWNANLALLRISPFKNHSGSGMKISPFKNQSF